MSRTDFRSPAGRPNQIAAPHLRIQTVTDRSSRTPGRNSRSLPSSPPPCPAAATPAASGSIPNASTSSPRSPPAPSANNGAAPIRRPAQHFRRPAAPTRPQARIPQGPGRPPRDRSRRAPCQELSRPGPLHVHHGSFCTSSRMATPEMVPSASPVIVKNAGELALSYNNACNVAVNTRLPFAPSNRPVPPVI